MRGTTRVIVRIGLLVVFASLVLVSVSEAQKGKAKATPRQPLTPLTATFDNGDAGAIWSDGGSYFGYRYVGAVPDGAFIKSPGALTINLVPENTARDRMVRFYAPITNRACALPGWVRAPRVDFRFNVGRVERNGNLVLLGIESMGVNGVPAVIESGGVTPGYDIAAAIDFLPQEAGSNVTSFALVFDRVAGTTLSRAADIWTLTSTATVRVQCTVADGRRRTTHDVGRLPMPFSMTARKQ